MEALDVLMDEGGSLIDKSLGQFIGAAKSLSRNPLGIIALFIVLVYGFAVLLFGLSAEHLDSFERKVLVMFVVLFPVLVLGTFHNLVAKHHLKLYSPQDFKDESNFFRTPTAEERQDKLVGEVLEAEALAGGTEPDEPVGTGQPGESGEETRALLPMTRKNAMQQYMLAEGLAFRALEEEFKTPVQQGAIVQGHRDLGFDGLILAAGRLILVEVKLVRHSGLAKKFLERSKERADFFRKETGLQANFLLAVVADMDDTAHKRLQNRLADIQKELEFPTDLRVYRLADLEAKLEKALAKAD